MNAPRRARASAAVAMATALLSLAACGGGGDSQAGDRSQFPESDFPPGTFDGLSGSLAWYDGSGGATTKARQDTIFKNYTTLTGVTTQPDFTGDTAKFFAAMENGGQVPWSLVEFPTKGDYIKARDAGLLEKIDTSKVPVDQLEEGTYDEYGMDVMRYGINLTYNTEVYPESGEQPDNMTDLYDTEKFPGKRCMYQYPQFGGTLESALLADGVEKEDLYPLDTARAYKKLDTIKKDIVWWSDGDEALRLLTSGECDLGVAWSGRVFNAVDKDETPLAISWNNAMYTTAAYAVPKGAPNAEAGQAALAMWILDKKGQEQFMSQIPYTTAIEGLEFPSEVTSWLPADDNAEAAIEEDAEYYAENIGDLADEFTTWVSKK